MIRRIAPASYGHAQDTLAYCCVWVIPCVSFSHLMRHLSYGTLIGYILRLRRWANTCQDALVRILALAVIDMSSCSGRVDRMQVTYTVTMSHCDTVQYGTVMVRLRLQPMGLAARLLPMPLIAKTTVLMSL